MQTDSVVDDFIVSVFMQVKTLKPGPFNTKLEWFKSVNSLLAAFKLNSKIQTSMILHRPSMDRIRREKDFVKINNFSILTVTSLYTMSMLNLYNDADKWSHPIVVYMMTHKSRLKRLFFKLPADDLWVKFKLYINMIYGFLNASPSLGNVENNLNVECIGDPKEAIQIEAASILESVVSELKLKGSVVVSDIDEILIDHRVRLPGDVLSGTYLSHVENSCDQRDLNRICRKHKIDILLGQTTNPLTRLGVILSLGNL